VIDMKDGTRELIQKIQSIMVESAKDTFEEPQLDDLRCLIRLTIEFNDFLQDSLNDLRHIDKLRKKFSDGVLQVEDEEIYFNLTYSIGSIFSGIESFVTVNSEYKVLIGSTSCAIDWSLVSMDSFKEQYTCAFKKFIDDVTFENKCRLLLDLFKLQIVFSGMFYM